jgi:WD40 repeat protein
MSRRRKTAIMLVSLTAIIGTASYIYIAAQSTWVESATFDDVGGAVEFAPDGKTFAARTGEYLWDLGEWNLTTGRPLWKRRLRDASLLRYDPDGILMVVRAKDSVALWNETTGARLAEIGAPFEEGLGEFRVAVSPDHSRAILSYDHGVVRIYGLPEGRLISTFSTSHAFLYCTELSHDGQTIALGGRLKSGSTSPAVILINVTDGSARATVPMSRVPRCLAFSADDAQLAIGYGGLRYTFFTGVTQFVGSPDSCFGRVLICNSRTGDEIATLGDQDHWIGCMAFSPDGTMLAAGGIGGPAPEPHVVMVWDNRTQKKVAVLRSQTGDIETVSFSPDGKLLATTSNGGWRHRKWTLKLWNVPGAK